MGPLFLKQLLENSLLFWLWVILIFHEYVVHNTYEYELAGCVKYLWFAS